MGYAGLPQKTIVKNLSDFLFNVYEGTRNEKTPDKFQQDFKAAMATEAEQVVARLAKAEAREGQPVKNNGLGTPCE